MSIAFKPKASKNKFRKTSASSSTSFLSHDLIEALLQKYEQNYLGDQRYWYLLARECEAIDERRENGWDISEWQEGLDMLQRAFLPFRPRSRKQYDDPDLFEKLDHSQVRKAGEMLHKEGGFNSMHDACTVWMPKLCQRLTELLWDGIGDWKA